MPLLTISGNDFHPPPLIWKRKRKNFYLGTCEVLSFPEMVMVPRDMDGLWMFFRE